MNNRIEVMRHKRKMKVLSIIKEHSKEGIHKQILASKLSIRLMVSPRIISRYIDELIDAGLIEIGVNNYVWPNKNIVEEI